MQRKLIAALAVMTIGAHASAQDDPEYVPEELVSSELENGWGGFLTIGGTVNGTSNSNVPGQVDGNTWNYGLNLDGVIELIDGPSEWRNSLSYVAGVQRTPQLPVFVKSTDQLDVETLYQYHLRNPSWLGPFARARMNTSVFQGMDVRTNDDPGNYYTQDGEERTDLETTSRFLMTAPFSPLTTRESVGFFAQPINEDAIVLDIRLGAGARQVQADGQYALADDGDATDADVLVDPLNSYSQAGLENVVSATGALEDGRVTYQVANEIMIPFINDTDEAPLDLMNVDFIAGLSFKLVDWASIDYQFVARSEPALGLEDPWQVSNNLLLTFTQVLAGAPEE